MSMVIAPSPDSLIFQLCGLVIRLHRCSSSNCLSPYIITVIIPGTGMDIGNKIGLCVPSKRILR